MAVKKGFIVELFKILGVYFSLFFGLQFTPGLGKFFSEKTPIPIDSAKTFVFLLIIALTLLLFKLISSGLAIIFKVETISSVNKVGSFILGMIRTYLCIGLIVVFFATSSIDYLKASAKDCFVYPYVVTGTRGVYNFSYGVLNKFIANIETNEEMEGL